MTARVFGIRGDSQGHPSPLLGTTTETTDHFISVERTWAHRNGGDTILYLHSGIGTNTFGFPGESSCLGLTEEQAYDLIDALMKTIADARDIRDGRTT